MLINNFRLKIFELLIHIVTKQTFNTFPFLVLYLDFDVYIVSLLVWTISSKKFTSIQENTIAVLANLYGELSLRWPIVFRIFLNELIETLNG